MVQSIIDINIKDAFLELELNPEFIIKLNKVKMQKGLRFKEVNDLRKHIENLNL
tara:strand:- start:355 stop:516 length:162 start_codon:yes stop_codon:yes gene_type:complete